jgi:hypothetical protein
MVYFSLATLCYSDILRSSPFTQMLAVLEAVIGQYFIAVLMAWLVGMFIYDKGQKSGRLNRLVQYWLNARTRFALRPSQAHRSPTSEPRSTGRSKSLQQIRPSIQEPMPFSPSWTARRLGRNGLYGCG